MVLHICSIDWRHQPPRRSVSEMLKRCIKADQLDVVQNLTDKYDYFD